jgi:hypothetical protein
VQYVFTLFSRVSWVLALWLFAHNASAAQIDYTSTLVRPVPIPAALWLFIGSSLALGGLRRKR